MTDLRARTLSERHHQMLVTESGIAPEVVDARGYFTATTRAELRELGFGVAQCLTPALVIPVHGTTGDIDVYQARPDAPRVRKKKPVKYETPKGARMALDIHPGARGRLGDPAIPLFITEGVKKGDALVTHGCCAIALLGVWNFRGTNSDGGITTLADWDDIAFNSREVIIVYDSDVMTKSEVHQALNRLKALLERRGARVRVVYLPSGAGGAKQGVDDFLARGHSIDDLLALSTPVIREPTNSQLNAQAGDHPQVDGLVEIGRQHELFHDNTDTTFATIETDNHREVWPIERSKRYQQRLQKDYRGQFGTVPSSDATARAIQVLAAEARFDGPTREVHNRVARLEDVIYYDLADADWRVIRVTKRGWAIEATSPIAFRRYAHQVPQVTPIRGGNLWDLFEFVNVQASDQLLLLAALVTAFIPDIPHPILSFHGAQGAGKSLGQRMLRRLIDPSAIPTMSLHSDPKELTQQLDHHYAPVFDNVDHLSAQQSDMLCRAVTGEGSTKRELYTDDDDVIRCFRRVIMVNGIGVAAQRPDLLDRSILIGLERIPRTDRRTERTMWADFEAALPGLLGAMLDALAEALQIDGDIKLPELERMADFTLSGAAVAMALGRTTEEFTAAYRANIGRQTVEAINADPVGSAVMALMKDRREWHGTPSELLRALEDAGETAGLIRRPGTGKFDRRGWPGAPHIMGRRLDRIRSDLSECGIHCNAGRADAREWVITRTDVQSPELSVGSDGSVDADAQMHSIDASVAASDSQPGLL